MISRRSEHEPKQQSFANIEIEKAVLGSLIAGGRPLIDKLGVEAIDLNLFFYSQSHKILSAIAELYDNGAPYDLQIVTEQLRQQGALEGVGGVAAITVLGIDGNSDPDIVRYNLALLRDLEVKRRTAQVAERMQRGDIDLEEARKVLDEITRYSHDPHKPLIEFRSPLQLRNFKPPPGIVLVGDCHIVRGNVSVIGGPPGVGKSRSSVTLAAAGATGSDWFGLSVHRRFKTMIIQTENGLFRLSKEFAELDCEGLENYVRICPPPPFGLCLEREDFRAHLSAAIQAFGPDVIILDPWNAAARDEKAREYLGTFELIRSLLPAGDDSPAIVIVAHTRKPRADERATGRSLLNLLAGSYVLGSVPRTAFIMQAASDDTTDNRVVWTCCKNNDGDLGLRSAWERRNGLFSRVAEFDWETFDNPHKDERVTITADDLAEIFENGEKQLTRAEAVKALQTMTEAGRTACYNALRLDGRFAKQLRESNGLLSWKA
jgi:AAA domain/DnaB-like helicase N terminal domain